MTTDRDAPPTLVSDLGMSVADTTDRQATRAGVTAAAECGLSGALTVATATVNVTVTETETVSARVVVG